MGEMGKAEDAEDQGDADGAERIDAAKSDAGDEVEIDKAQHGLIPRGMPHAHRDRLADPPLCL